MEIARSARARSSPRPQHVHKAHGTLHPRVQAVGPEHFAIVSIDCAKLRSKWMMTDFFGQLLVPPTVVEHNTHAFRDALQLLERVRTEKDVRDLIVAIERTGSYHHPVKQAFVQAGFEVRIVHPFATKQFRMPADPGVKTDDTDLAAIHRATVTGFGLAEPPETAESLQIRLLARHRRDLVRKNAKLRCQIQEHLQAFLPGYSQCFDDIFDSNVAMWIAKTYLTPDAILQAGLEGLTRAADEAGVRYHASSLHHVLDWARSAPPGDPAFRTHQRVFAGLEADRRFKLELITVLERDLAGVLVQTPYVRLLGAPGLNVVAAAELAGEMGPIGGYANANTIKGRAGLYPSRYQSDAVDRRDGPLVRRCNRALRRVLLMIADSLIHCNDHFKNLSKEWRRRDKDPRDIHVKVADRFCRIAFQVVAGGQSYRHPCCRQWHYVLEKLTSFHDVHATSYEDTLKDLRSAAVWLPVGAHREERERLTAALAGSSGRRGRRSDRRHQMNQDLLAALSSPEVEYPPSGESSLD
jgi:transposase